MASNRLRVVLNHLQQPTTQNTSKKNYKFTVENNFLTPEQREFYEDNGFIVIRKLIKDDLLEECKQRFADLCNGKAAVGNMIMMKDKQRIKTSSEGEDLYYKVQDIIWDEVFEKYALHPEILDYVQCFTGPDICVMQSMLLNKPPDTGLLTSQHPIHQDLHYFIFRPEERVVGVWTAIDKAEVQNGGLYVIPGTHKAALQPHGYTDEEVNVTYHTISGFHKIEKVSLIMEKGDTVFFHPLLFHGSWPNYSQGYRKAISCHYASSYCHFIDPKGTTSQEVAEEFEKLYSKKMGRPMTYVDIWRTKMRHVRGRRGTLI